MVAPLGPIGTMHLAKGLEFKAVTVMACDDEVLPLQSRIEAAADEIELEDLYETERQLLYVAATRARDRLQRRRGWRRPSSSAPGSHCGRHPAARPPRRRGARSPDARRLALAKSIGARYSDDREGM